MTETQDARVAPLDTSPPSLTLDWAKYGAMLDEWDGSDEQKQELIATLWSIVVSFVDLGFEVTSPDALSCGEDARMDEESLLDVVSSTQNQPKTAQHQEPRCPSSAEAARRSPPWV